MGIIYCHKNKITGKCYVGQTRRTLEQRIGIIPEKSYSNNKKFSQDIIKYGWQNFESSILETVDDDSTLNDRETYWINRIKETNDIYNKHLSGISNAKKTQKAADKISDFDTGKIIELFNKGMSLNEVSKIVGLSILSVRKVLLLNDYTIPNQGNKNSLEKEYDKKKSEILKFLKCPVCQKSLLNPSHLRCITCSPSCRSVYLKMSPENKKLIEQKAEENKEIYDMFLLQYKEDKEKYQIYLKNLQEKVKRERILNIKQTHEDRLDRIKPKQTQEERCWHKNETRCKQMLDLILNSGVNLMEFGYNTKLCKMFPELGKKIITFLLRKYDIPHFERVGSIPTNLSL